jgi:hypothetical protein
MRTACTTSDPGVAAAGSSGVTPSPTAAHPAAIRRTRLRTTDPRTMATPSAVRCGAPRARRGQKILRPGWVHQTGHDCARTVPVRSVRYLELHRHTDDDLRQSGSPDRCGASTGRPWPRRARPPPPTGRSRRERAGSSAQTMSTSSSLVERPGVVGYPDQQDMHIPVSAVRRPPQLRASPATGPARFSWCAAPPRGGKG